MRFLWHKAALIWLDFEYRTLLPLLSRLPQRAAFALFRLRAKVQFLLDYEWKTCVLGKKFLKESTAAALARITPDADAEMIRRLVLQRFIHESFDEYLSCLMSGRKGAELLDRVDIQGLDKLKEVKESSGIVFVSMHYDAFCLGLAALGRQGLNMHVVNTEAIEGENIPAGVREYYRRKYAAMERLMNGGMPYVERFRRVFVEALQRRDCVGLMGDIPGKRSTVIRPMFGAPFRVPLGAWKFARESGAKLSAFVCIRESGHRYRIEILPPYAPGEDPLDSMRPVYDFLEGWIRRYPDRWTSSYLLLGYEG